MSTPPIFTSAQEQEIRDRLRRLDARAARDSRRTWTRPPSELLLIWLRTIVERYRNEDRADYDTEARAWIRAAANRRRRRRRVERLLQELTRAAVQLEQADITCRGHLPGGMGDATAGAIARLRSLIGETERARCAVDTAAR